MLIKIATLNLCLCLLGKNEINKKLIINEQIDILSLPEAEVIINFDSNLLSFMGYCYENEKNSIGSKVGVNVNS
jgi:hypothetical protein